MDSGDKSALLSDHRGLRNLPTQGAWLLVNAKAKYFTHKPNLPFILRPQ